MKPQLGNPKETSSCEDHDRGNNQVRDLLCDRCNCLLGWAKDDIGLLWKAIQYLSNHKEIKHVS